jgi:hypothetical protein
MQWFINSLLSNLIVIVLVALANNLCFVAIAKARNWRLKRKDTITKLEGEIEHLEACNQKLHDKLAAYSHEHNEQTIEQPTLILTHFGKEELNVVNA